MTAPIRALALHCMMGSGSTWAGVAGALGPGIRLTTPDLPGHGKAPPWLGDEDYLPQCLRSVEALWDGEPHLIGHSFGAVLALHLAARHPERVASLVLIEPVLFAAAAGGPGHADHAARSAPALEAARAGDTLKAAALFHELWGIGTLQDLSDRARRRMAAAMPIIANQDYVLTGPDAPDVLRQVDAPCTVIVGTESHPVIGEIADQVSSRLPATRVEIQGAAHMAPVTHPEVVAAAIADHLSPFTAPSETEGRRPDLRP